MLSQVYVQKYVFCVFDKYIGCDKATSSKPLYCQPGRHISERYKTTVFLWQKLIRIIFGIKDVLKCGLKLSKCI